MLVTLKPEGREEYRLKLDGQAVFSSSIFGGYEQAQIPCELYDEDRVNALGGRLRIHGERGDAWRGRVNRRPGKGEPLLAKGWGDCANDGRLARLFADTSLTEWQERTHHGRNRKLGCQVDGPVLRVTMEENVSIGTKSNGFLRRIPVTTASKHTFGWNRPSTSIRIRLLHGMYSHTLADGQEFTSWTEVTIANNGSGSLSGTASVDISGSHDCVALYVDAPGGYNPGSDVSVYFTDLTSYGQASSTVTTSALFRSIIDTEIATMYLPAGDAYRAWITSEATSVVPFVFDEPCSAADKLEELAKYAAYDYGWYMEMVAGQPFCVPHWTPRSTTPDYILHLDNAESYDLDESSLDELISAQVVNYEDAQGRSQAVVRYDDDNTHPLVHLGIVRFGENISAQTTSQTVAEAIGDLALADDGREQVKGQASTRTLLSATGAPVYLPSVRPGRMVRVMGLPGGQRDCIINRATCYDDELVNLELDNAPYHLSIALALLAKNQQPRRAKRSTRTTSRW